MADYDNKNRGVLFENDRKEKDTQPDMKGSLNIDGAERWLSAWWKDGRNGRYLSLSLGDVKQQQGQSRPAPAPAPRQDPNKYERAKSGFDDMDDDIPF